MTDILCISGFYRQVIESLLEVDIERRNELIKNAYVCDNDAYCTSYYEHGLDVAQRDTLVSWLDVIRNLPGCPNEDDESRLTIGVGDKTKTFKTEPGW